MDSKRTSEIRLVHRLRNSRSTIQRAGIGLTRHEVIRSEGPCNPKPVARQNCASRSWSRQAPQAGFRPVRSMGTRPRTRIPIGARARFQRWSWAWGDGADRSRRVTGPAGRRLPLWAADIGRPGKVSCPTAVDAAGEAVGDPCQRPPGTRLASAMTACGRIPAVGKALDHQLTAWDPARQRSRAAVVRRGNPRRARHESLRRRPRASERLGASQGQASPSRWPPHAASATAGQVVYGQRTENLGRNGKQIGERATATKGRAW